MPVGSSSKGGVSVERRLKSPVLRLSAWALFALLIFVPSLSAGFLLFNANHLHDHDGPKGCCSTCARMELAVNAMTAFSLAAAGGAAFALVNKFAVTPRFKSSPLYRGFFSLVSLKIRLNN
ncbi:MAG: hypothetical protein LBR61_07070 [Synergistaceae bacterium]|jgi:hypothetical protein|nr:hypothetical protein [Synergistaceae bacterium]